MDRNDLIFPFGMLSAIITLFVIIAVLLLKHPSNITGQVTVADYLFSLAIFSFIPVLLFANYDTTMLNKAQYSIVGFAVSFLLGMGLLAIVKQTAFSTVDTSYLATLSVSGIPDELFMLFVAVVEELMFRIAIPVVISRVLIMLPREAKWAGAVLVSSVLFGFWHVFAYNANTDMMLLAVTAGIIFSVAFRIGTLFGGGDLAFAGIIAGHYFWNLSTVGLPTALPSVILFVLVIVLFVSLVNPRFNEGMARGIGTVRRVIGT